jgi:hypothetical protein
LTSAHASTLWQRVHSVIGKGIGIVVFSALTVLGSELVLFVGAESSGLSLNLLRTHEPG